MSLNAIQKYLKDQLTGVTAADWGPTQVYVAPPVAGDLRQPALFIWGGRGHEYRQTMGRPNGHRKADWEVDMYLKAQIVPGDLREDEKFALLMDAVMDILRKVKMVDIITDPTTENTFQLVSVGEDFVIDYLTPHAGSSQRIRIYECRITVKMEEVFIG